MSEDTYNGWTSWATWNVNLWLANEEPMYRDVRRLTRAYANPAKLARRLELYVIAAGTTETGWHFGDIESLAELSAVDWREIADSWTEDESCS